MAVHNKPLSTTTGLMPTRRLLGSSSGWGPLPGELTFIPPLASGGERPWILNPRPLASQPRLCHEPPSKPGAGMWRSAGPGPAMPPGAAMPAPSSAGQELTSDRERAGFLSSASPSSRGSRGPPIYSQAASSAADDLDLQLEPGVEGDLEELSPSPVGSHGISRPAAPTRAESRKCSRARGHAGV